MSQPQYSVVVPVYNSEGSLSELFERMDKTFKKLNETFEVVFVDDFSKDKSWEVLTRLKNQYNDRVKIIGLARNYGQHNATVCGFSFCKGAAVITIDDDLQNPP